MKLFLKGKRCDTNKCKIDGGGGGRPAPGGKNRPRGKMSNFGRGMREKQKLKLHYGLLEGQLKKYFAKALRNKGNTGDNLIVFIERRLDNVIKRLGLGHSPRHARQLVNHGHIYVNGHRVDVPSYQVRTGDVITVTKKEKVRAEIEKALWYNQKRGMLPTWLEFDQTTWTGKVLTLPTVEERAMPVEIQLVVEFCSR